MCSAVPKDEARANSTCVHLYPNVLLRNVRCSAKGMKQERGWPGYCCCCCCNSLAATASDKDGSGSSSSQAVALVPAQQQQQQQLHSGGGRLSCPVVTAQRAPDWRRRASSRRASLTRPGTHHPTQSSHRTRTGSQTGHSRTSLAHDTGAAPTTPDAASPTQPDQR